MRDGGYGRGNRWTCTCEKTSGFFPGAPKCRRMFVADSENNLFILSILVGFRLVDT